MRGKSEGGKEGKDPEMWVRAQRGFECSVEALTGMLSGEVLKLVFLGAANDPLHSSRVSPAELWVDERRKDRGAENSFGTVMVNQEVVLWPWVRAVEGRKEWTQLINTTEAIFLICQLL